MMAGLDYIGATRKDIRIPIQYHFASRDNWCNPAAVDALETAMKAAWNPPEVHRYEADHAFFNPMRPEVYSPEKPHCPGSSRWLFLQNHLEWLNS